MKSSSVLSWTILCLSSWRGSGSTVHSSLSTVISLRAGSRDFSHKIGTRRKPPSDLEKSSKRLIYAGDVGNLLTTVLSFWLLYKTPFNIRPCGLGLCSPVQTNGAAYTGSLDPCYVCDGFCISNAGNEWKNSHMLSLYGDIAMFLPLLALRRQRKERLCELGLNDFYLNSLKVNSIMGHGVAHFALSMLTQRGIVTGTKTQLVGAAALLLARFAHKNTWNQIRYYFYHKESQSRNSAKEHHRLSFWRATVAPFLAGTLLAQLTSVSQAAGLIQYAVFGLTCYIFFEAGIPHSTHSWVFALGMATIATYLSVGVIGVENVQQSFVVVFTCSYLVSAIYQMFFWKEKNAHAVPYAITAWVSNLITTLVGWLLALRCTAMKQLGGHVWYDLSIPLSYFMLYKITDGMSKNKVKK